MTAVLGALLVASTAAAQTPPAEPCRASEVSRNLDFWVGDWDVYVGSKLVGTDKVDRIMSGCAVTERWRDTQGGEGFSLFAYDARRDMWTQTWVTADTSQNGGLKVKTLRAHTPTTVTFQGELESKTGVVYYDRTILTALPAGRVRQQIQISRDGVAWPGGFDAIYVPHGQKP